MVFFCSLCLYSVFKRSRCSSVYIFNGVVFEYEILNRTLTLSYTREYLVLYRCFRSHVRIYFSRVSNASFPFQYYYIDVQFRFDFVFINRVKNSFGFLFYFDFSIGFLVDLCTLNMLQ